MSFERILGQFTKSGDWHQYSRRFHALTRSGKQICLELIQAGIEPALAIRKARRIQC